MDFTFGKEGCERVIILKINQWILYVESEVSDTFYPASDNNSWWTHKRFGRSTGIKEDKGVKNY